ncbi:hypothetical protein BDQ12DRAFT_124232 [Crucibulum laeve]|uniref:Protoporphyrinogen oxidase n=1 Tax=Crucibulum laeve TaxID=68775 RepID=A0A5C3M217_9AGAR|nr:hypothetical protein BDQ12DRAFT_124232 [Crucibulum laeve]
MAPGHVAILGGGLTGLSSALHLSRRFPGSRITLLEKQTILGGWVRSERVQIHQSDASVVLEAGPRTLRPNAKSILELINILNLQDSVITVSKTSPAAKARFLYVPKDSAAIPKIEGLQQLPSSILSLLSSPFRSIMLPAIMRELIKRSNRPKATDESVDSFLARRFGESFARTFGSALVHGIYAADSRKLSVRAAFPTLWQVEDRGGGSLIRGLIVPQRINAKQRTADNGNYDLGNTLEMMQDASVYSFRDGMETLTCAMENYLKAQSNVHILPGTGISRLVHKNNKSIELLTTSGEILSPTHVVSALPLHALHSIISDSNSLNLPHLTANPTSTVHVVNFVFPCAPAQIHPAGFGYLIPRPIAGYPSSSTPSSPGILGTVFDSCSLYAQDTPSVPDYFNNGRLTKLTLMTGGPYPTPSLPPHLSSPETDGSIPDVVRRLLRNLELHLGKKLPDPVYWRVRKNEACIPTLLPGHVDRMEEMKKILLGSGDGRSGWDGRLEIVGAGVGGVSVGDCVEAGKHVGKHWV